MLILVTTVKDYSQDIVCKKSGIIIYESGKEVHSISLVCDISGDALDGEAVMTVMALTIDYEGGVQIVLVSCIEQQKIYIFTTIKQQVILLTLRQRVILLKIRQQIEI